MAILTTLFEARKELAKLKELYAEEEKSIARKSDDLEEAVIHCAFYQSKVEGLKKGIEEGTSHLAFIADKVTAKVAELEGIESLIGTREVVLVQDEIDFRELTKLKRDGIFGGRGRLADSWIARMGPMETERLIEVAQNSHQLILSIDGVDEE